jgi:hypothetical protein
MHVQWLPIAEIAELWAPHLGTSKDIIIEELRRGYFKFEKSKTDRQFVCGQPLRYRPPEDELPSIYDHCITQEFMRLFCKHNRWPLPDFWFEPERRKQGRPAIMPAIVQELNRRAGAGELEKTAGAQARVLHSWARVALAREQVPAEKTIYNQTRVMFRCLKQDVQVHRNI